jgi:hypothetical protein
MKKTAPSTSQENNYLPKTMKPDIKMCMLPSKKQQVKQWLIVNWRPVCTTVHSGSKKFKKMAEFSNRNSKSKKQWNENSEVLKNNSCQQ